MSKRKINLLIRAALDLAAEMPWDAVRLSDIAARAGEPLARVRYVASTKDDIVLAAARDMDIKLAEMFGKSGNSGSAKDRLFDIMMERFEQFSADAAAWRSIFGSAKRDPKQVLIGLPSCGQSVAQMLDLAGMNTDGWRGCGYLAQGMAVYVSALWAWLEDDSADMPKTMAALDKALSRFGFN